MALRENKLKRTIKEGGFALGVHLSSARDPEIVYHLGAAGADFVFIDLEHGTFGLETTIDLIWHSHAAGITPLIRIPDLQYEHVTRLQDNGAQSFLVPHLKEPAEVERLLDLTKYAPDGHRGFAMGGAGTNWTTVTDHVAGAKWANDNMFLGLNIETAESVENLDGMLVPGIDFVIVGWGDLSQAYGIMGQFQHERILAVKEKNDKMCEERGIARMVAPGTTPGSLRAAVEAGDQIIQYGSTSAFIKAGLAPAVAELKEATA